MMEEKSEEELARLAEEKKAANARADAAVEAELQEEEQEAAGDCDDPFAMMGGMGAEEVYTVTMLKEHTPEELQQMQGKAKAAEAKADAAIEAEEQEEEEEDAGGCDDPFAMMGGMGAEEVYTVTMLKEHASEEL